jgi:hypothetical protein
MNALAKLARQQTPDQMVRALRFGSRAFLVLVEFVIGEGEDFGPTVLDV